MADTTAKQRKIVERLQLLWLERMETLLKDGELSATDAATLYRFMADNGWSLDPAKLPGQLREKLTGKIEFDEADDGLGLAVVR